MYFQIGASSGILIALFWMLFNKSSINTEPKYAFLLMLAGFLVSISTIFIFKTIDVGPGVSTIIPIFRIVSICGVAVLGVLLFKEQLSFMSWMGIVISLAGVYLIYRG